MLKRPNGETNPPADPPEVTTYDEWEELSDDNGDRVEFEPGMTKEGFFFQRATIALTNEMGESNGETADLLVFADAKQENRWNMWENFTVRKINFVQGDQYRISCTGTRKTSQGNMKVYSVKHKVTKVEEPF